MHDCYVASNGNNIRTGAGILASHGSALLLRCNEINGNYGPGIYLHAGGTIAMHDFVGSANRGGNDISNNSFIGQIYTDCPSIKMPGGVNRIANSFAPSPLIVYRANEPDLPENQEIPVNGNNWGYTGTGHEQEIMDRLIPTGNFALENFEYEPNWSLCGEVIDPTFSECDSIWTQATLDMQLGEYEDAATLFKQIVKELPECSYAKPAAEQVSLAEKLAGTTLDDLRDTLLALRDETEDQALKFALAKRAAETSALDGNFITALSELDSLADGAPSSTDSVTALVSYACVTFLQAIMDSTDTLGTYTHFDTLQARLAALEAVLIDTSEHKPVVDHAPPTSVSAANDTFRVQANCYPNAAEDIRDVVIDYRFCPTGEWERDTLLPTQVGSDSLWYLDIPLDSIGGGLTYRLVVIDSAWSFETWPVSDHGSGVYDTLTHFISFEPRVRRLQDTAHVYAPGVLTGDMRIDDGGVLQFLPSPLGGTDTVKIDSGVGISLEGSGGTLPVFSVTGTDNQAIVLTCEDPQDYWSGITAISGLADLRHCTIDRAEQPLYCNNLDARPIVVRMDSCEVNHFLLPLVISRTNAGQADSSYILHTTIQHGDSIGLWFGKEVSIDLADLTVQDCEDQGLWVALGNTLLLENCTVSGNGAAGLAWADEAINVQLSQCTFSLNGDSLPEIVASDQGVLELSNCILRDSTGVLLEADTVANLDLEFGSNYFQILDTATQNHTYISVADANPVCYLTGNYFSPEFVNDSTFVEDYLVPDELNSWIYTYLHLEHEQAEPVANPGDSLQLLAKSFLQNYVGSLSSDSISEVGFKYKVLPDQSTWTTRRVNEDRADSAYSWWVPVGNDGGLISYIFWSKDTHGRFLTSPLGADTTAPDSGNTHYLSFTLQDTVITQDSVVIYAPTTLTHTIQVDLGGRLVIKPWPGASDHTITLADGVSILVAPNAFGSRPKLWIEGTEDMPITFTNLTDSTEWDELRVYYGDATANYAIFEGAVSALQTYGDSPVIKFDHCTFDGAQSFLYWDGISSSSYMRNCVFTNLGEGTCGVLIGSTTMEITDCWFYNNRGFGLWGYDLGNSEISGCNFVSNDLGGVCSDGLVSSVSFSCNEFSFNGGDSTAEVFANGGAFDFSDGSGNVFADHAGSLFQCKGMPDFEIDGWENGFYLFDSTGFFIEIGDQTDTMNISGNYWYPFDPDTSIFWNHMDPDTSRYWRVDSIAPEVASCMQGQGFSLPEGGPTELVRPNMEGAGIASHHGSKGSAVATKQSSLRSLTAARKQAMTTNALYMQAKELQEAKDYANAAAAFEQFITANPNDPHIGAALSRHFVSAKAAGVAGSLLPFYQEQEKRLTSPGTRRIAHELSLEAMALSGDPQRALTGYEELMKTATNLHDSVRAVIATMYLSYRYGQDGKLRMRFPENRVSDFKDFAQRASKLSASLIHTPRAVNAEGASPAIPSAYRLHQNYPNPFNPVTEIRFDLPEAVRVELKVFNILGQEVATLMDAVRPAGAYHVQWDSRSTSGVTVGSGVYIYQLKAGNFVDSKKMVLIR